MSSAPASIEELLARFRYRPDEQAGAGIELPFSALEPDVPGVAEEVQLLTFGLGSAEYAVPLGSVTEILRARPLTEIPRARPPLLGVLNLRGTITPIFDPALRLGRPSTLPVCAGPECPPVPRAARLLVVRTGLGPAGLWVDRVRGVLRVRPAQLERPAGGPTGGVLGVLRSAEGACTVVDPEWLLR